MSVINNDPNTLMVKCNCYSHVLEVTSDALGVIDGITPDFYFTIWNQTPIPYSFIQRLKLIWNLIFGKNLNGADIIVDLSDAVAISKFLAEKVEESRNLQEQRKLKKQTNG